MRLSDTKWLEWLLGLDTSSIPEDAQIETTFTNLPHSWQVFVLIAVVGALAYFVYWLYRREMATCPIWAKRVLAAVPGVAGTKVSLEKGEARVQGEQLSATRLIAAVQTSGYQAREAPCD